MIGETYNMPKLNHYNKYHTFRCRRCEKMLHRSQVVRTNDGYWICKRCKSNDDEIAKKVYK